MSQKNILKHSPSFFGERWFGLKEMSTNKGGQSDIVTHKTNTWNKIVPGQKDFSLHL